MRIIDADALLEQFFKDTPYGCGKVGIKYVDNLIKNFPTLDILERITKALEIAYQYGQIDGEHHKTWVIDQIVRTLCGNEEEYKKWIKKYEEPLEDGDYYSWDKGINP